MDFAHRLIENVKTVIVDKHDIVERTVVCMLAGGHLLLEDVPGTGKTTLAKAMARSLAGAYRRVQGTPDLMPADITGVSIFNQKTNEFEFKPGPVFTDVLLADEINRATPRAQSALLEAMGEGSVTVDGHTHQLSPTFLVLATMNPLENKGTYALPEAQMDRFLMRMSMGYPGLERELDMVYSQAREHPVDLLGAVASVEELRAAQRMVRATHVDRDVARYAAHIVEATRKSTDLLLGASPRALLGLVRAAQALARVKDRDYVVPSDIQALAEPVLAHRLIVKPATKAAGRTVTQVLAGLVDAQHVPV